MFGRLCAFAATLKKGDHVQIQGQLQNREYEKVADSGKNAPVKQHVAQIRVTSILKLDRSYKQSDSEQEGAPA